MRQKSEIIGEISLLIFSFDVATDFPHCIKGKNWIPYEHGCFSFLRPTTEMQGFCKKEFTVLSSYSHYFTAEFLGRREPAASLIISHRSFPVVQADPSVPTSGVGH